MKRITRKARQQIDAYNMTAARLDNESRVMRHMSYAAETARDGGHAQIFIVGTNGTAVGAHADWANLDGPSRSDRFIQGDHAAEVFA